MATVTIGIPVYNEERYLAKTIESALGQSFTDLRLIITDNCSTDKSYDIAREYEKSDKRVRVVRHPENMGMINNFNYSLAISDTKYFAWLGAHDIFLKDYLKEAVDVLEKAPGVIMAYPKSVLVDENDILIRDMEDDIDTTGLSMRERLFKIIRKSHYGISIHGIFRTDVLKKIPFDSVYGTDHLLLFRAGFYGDIKKIEPLGIKMKKVRPETPATRTERWKEVKLYTPPDNGLSPELLTMFKHAEYQWKLDNISLREKVTLSIGIKKVFSVKEGLTWLDLLRQKYPLINSCYLSLTRIIRTYKRLKHMVKLYVLRVRLQRMKPLNVVLGSGGEEFAGWFSTDKDILDVTSSRNWQILFKPGSVDRLLAEHLFEHLSKEECEFAFKQAYRYLRPGGLFRIAVPDDYRRDKRYIEEAIGLKDGHKALYNVDVLVALLEKVGFRVTPLEYFNSEGKFCFVPWDGTDGHVKRSRRYDKQELFKIGDMFYTSLIVDARKDR